MGWTIAIGNAELDTSWGEQLYDCSARWVVRDMSLPEAPYFADSKQSNTRWPSYGQWAHFTKAIGLYDLFHDRDEGLLCNGSQARPLNKEHLQLFEDALLKFKADNPGIVAGFCNCKACDLFAKDETIQHNPNLDGTLARLEWLVWWTRWTLDNCERPAIYAN